MTWLTNPYRFGAPQVSGPHRYWRMVGHPTNDVWFDIAELAIAETAGGANIGTAGNTTSNFPASITKLYDGIITDAWVASLGTNWPTGAGYLQWDFGTPRSIAEIRITAQNNSTNWRCVKAWCLQGSNDGVEWFTYYIICQNADYTAGQTQSFAIPSSTVATVTRETALAWALQFNLNVSGSAEVAIAEMQFYDASDNPLINNPVNCATFLGRTFGAGGVGSRLVPAVDGLVATFYNVNSGPKIAGIYFNSPPPAIKTIGIIPRAGFHGFQSPASFDLQWTADYENWNIVQSWTGLTGWVANPTERLFTVTA